MKQFDFKAFLTDITATPGLSGYEGPVAGKFAEAFAPYVDEVSVSETGVIAVQNGTGKGPTVMLTAHIDEVGLVSTLVEEDGSIRFMSMGVATQILPGQEVNVLAKEGPLFGVIGSVPPHVMTAEDKKKAVRAQELYIDVGLPAEKVKALVPPGTPVQLTGPVTQLAGDCIASKTLDDRACAAILLACAQELSKMEHDAKVVYLLAAREEFDSFGAMTGSERIRPDMAFALDVTHGKMDGCAEGETYSLNSSTLAVGPNLHRRLTDVTRNMADRLHMKVETEVASGHTGTDAWAIQIACEGIPCVLLSLPIKYMHTTVELASIKLMAEQAHLLAQTVASFDEHWEELVCC